VFSDDLVRFVHCYGLNLCDLGLVYHLLDKPKDMPWKRRILVEVYARSVRRVVESLLYERVQTARVAISESIDVIKTLFFLILKGDPVYQGTLNKWVDECFPCLKDYPTPACLFSEESEPYLLEAFLTITSNLLGITWENKLWEKRKDKDFFRNPEKSPFCGNAIRDIHPRVLEVNLANHARGLIAMEGEKCEIEDYESSLHHLRLALDRQPSNEHTIDRFARACAKLAVKYKKVGRMEEARVLLLKMKHWIQIACSLPDPHEDTLLSGALMWIEEANEMYAKRTERGPDAWKEPLKSARRLLKKAWEKNSKHRHVGFMLADVKLLLGSSVDDVLRYVTGDGLGKNGLYHRFRFMLMLQEWDEAAATAAQLRKQILEDSRRDPSDENVLKYINDFLSRL